MTSQFELSDDTPVYVISVAAQLSGMHPQTLRAYDRLGLVSPGRRAGRGRRYSLRDILILREVQRLSQEEGINLNGIKRILELELAERRSRMLARRDARGDQPAARRAGVDQGGRGRRPVAAGPTGRSSRSPRGGTPRVARLAPIWPGAPAERSTAARASQEPGLTRRMPHRRPERADDWRTRG